MKFNKSIIDIIKERTSRRTYDPKPLDNTLKERVKNLLKLENTISPFSQDAGKSRFKLIGMPEFDPNEKKKIGTYGLIEGAQEFIVGAIEKSKYAKEHFGYLMEYIILGATDMGLGTCWLGGTFNKSLFSFKINLNPDEILPAITPIGSFLEKRRMREIAIRKAIKADKRRPWKKLFFEGDFSKPLSQENAKKYETPLEMVRLGPSAGNKQPWRIIKETDKNIFHFYVVKAKGMYKPFPPLDLGIASCHWDLSVEELGIKGKWQFSHPEIPSEKVEYKISWIGD